MISLAHIQNAYQMIKDKIYHTPLVHSPTLTRMFASEVFLKLENLQKTGSFKIRGATHKLSIRSKDIGQAGVVAASAGNHAQGVALAATKAGIPATIVMPQWASISKQEATGNYGGKVVIHGETIGESLEHAQALVQKGQTLIHPFDDDDIIAGQGTIGLEILADLPDPDFLVVPVGGGGLIAGIATAAKALYPSVKIIGVQAAACPSAIQALRKGRSTPVAATASLADGITVKQTGQRNFDIIRRMVDQVVAVEEDMIAAAILLLLERKKILAEGSGAVPLAALMSGAFAPPENSKVVLVISGGNVDSPLLGRMINQGLRRNGRIIRISARLEDRPGSLARLLARVARMKANVLNIYHDRNVPDLPIYLSRVELELETRGREHAQSVLENLRQAGYVLDLEPDLEKA
jgi:threonine dehydratase